MKDHGYEVVITAVSERADLFAQTVDRLLASVDVQPTRLIVHEDVRPGSRPGAIADWLRIAKVAGRISDYEHRVTNPAAGLGPAMVWGFERATTQVVLYTQEDWLAVRRIPVADALCLMQEHDLNHIRWNKRKTMRAKHEDRPGDRWEKVEVAVGGQVLCVSDHWYTQTSLWRVDVARPGLAVAVEKYTKANYFVPAFNEWFNQTHGDGRSWNDQTMRHERIRTYIWGPVGEPKFVEHVGSTRGTGLIVNHLSEKGQP